MIVADKRIRAHRLLKTANAHGNPNAAAGLLSQERLYLSQGLLLFCWFEAVTGSWDDVQPGILIVSDGAAGVLHTHDGIGIALHD